MEVNFGEGKMSHLTNTEKTISGILARQAWERAKGELRSISTSFLRNFDDESNELPSNYSKFVKITEEYIKKVEEDSIHYN